MRFYVDFENVSGAGLRGVEKLKAGDTVIIYYSNNPSVSLEIVKKLLQSKAEIYFQKLSNEIKSMNFRNALDIVILNDISRVSKHQSIAIVSKDSGYDSMIKKFLFEGKDIQRISSISKLSEEPQTKKETEDSSQENNSEINFQEVSALFHEGGALASFHSSRNKIIGLIKKCKTRSEINCQLSKNFQGDTGKIMKALKPYIKHLPGE